MSSLDLFNRLDKHNKSAHG